MIDYKQQRENDNGYALFRVFYKLSDEPWPNRFWLYRIKLPFLLWWFR